MTKVDYQVLRPRGTWKNGGGMASFTPFHFAPRRLFTLAEGKGLVCLMTSLAGDHWIIYSLNAHGVPARSTIYDDRNIGEKLFRELCHRLVREAKDYLASRLSDPVAPLSGRERTDAALELARLELGDDEEHDEIIRQSREFVRTHSPEEFEARFQKDLAAYDATQH